MIEAFDSFEEKLHRSLQGDGTPSPDFAERVMAQIRRTPQEKAIPGKRVSASKTPKIKVWQIAACIALLVLAFPVVRLTAMRAGSAAPKMAGMEAAEGAAPGDCESPSEPAAAAYSYQYNSSYTEVKENTDAGEDSGLASQADQIQATLTVSDETLAEALRQWLDKHGYVDDGGYVLSAAEVQKLDKVFPELDLPVCTVQLILETEA